MKTDTDDTELFGVVRIHTDTDEVSGFQFIGKAIVFCHREKTVQIDLHTELRSGFNGKLFTGGIIELFCQIHLGHFIVKIGDENIFIRIIRMDG